MKKVLIGFVLAGAALSVLAIAEALRLADALLKRRHKRTAESVENEWLPLLDIKMWNSV